MTEYNDKADRIEANNWFGAKEALAALDALKFSFSALASQCGTPGSNERQLADLATQGFRHRVDYLHDSLRRLLKSGA
jgi:hypothetical protein